MNTPAQEPVFQRVPALRLLRDLARARGTAVHLVGGFLRDALLGRRSLDCDFAVAEDALGLARAFSRKVRGAFVLLDAERACARVVVKGPEETRVFDFAAFRAASFAADLRHRDFTINTLYLPVRSLTERSVPADARDRTGGLVDLRRRRLRMVGPAAFREDPLRLLRAFSLQASLGFRIEKETLRRIRADRAGLCGTARERIREELFRILGSPRAAATLRAMDRVGLLEIVIPEIRMMDRVRQGGYHHLDLWPHSLETVAQLERIVHTWDPGDEAFHAYLREPVGGCPRLSLIKFAALLHDVGKPETRRASGGRFTFHGHEHVGARIVRAVARRNKLSTRQRHMIEHLVRRHLRPGFLANFKRPSARAFFRYFRDTGEEAAAVALLAMADQRATRGPLTTEEHQRRHEAVCRELIRRHFTPESPERRRPRLITGHDLIRELHLTPGPRFAEILGTVEEQQALGRVRTRAEALALARRLESDLEQREVGL